MQRHGEARVGQLALVVPLRSAWVCVLVFGGWREINNMGNKNRLKNLAIALNMNQSVYVYKKSYFQSLNYFFVFSFIFPYILRFFRFCFVSDSSSSSRESSCSPRL